MHFILTPKAKPKARASQQGGKRQRIHAKAPVGENEDELARASLAALRAQDEEDLTLTIPGLDVDGASTDLLDSADLRKLQKLAADDLAGRESHASS